MFETAVAADEFLAIAGDCARRIVHIDEGNAAGELGVVEIEGQECAGLEIQFALHVKQAFRALVAQHPLPESCGGEACGRSKTLRSFRTANFTGASIAT